MKKRKGFTLIELLVVIAIIGLLSTLAVVALTSSRQKSRDAKRVSDVKQVQLALEMYYLDNEKYPNTGTTAVALALGGLTDCGSAVCNKISKDNGISNTASGTIYMGLIPPDPSGAVECSGTPTAPCVYSYVTIANEPNKYCILFYLEGDVGGLKKGANRATQDGISAGVCSGF